MLKQYIQPHLFKGLCLGLLFGSVLLFNQSAHGQTVTLNGSVYVDVDSSCTKGSKDVSPSSDSLRVYLLDNTGSKIDSTFTGTAGDYSFTVNTSNNSTVKVRLVDTGNYLHYCQSPTKTVSSPGSGSVNFGLTRPSGSFAKDLFVSGASSGNCIKPNQFDTFELDVASGTKGSVNYQVNFGDGSGYTIDRFARQDTVGNYSISFSNQYNSTGTYTITAYAVDGNGNADVQTLTVSVAQKCSSISGKIYADTNNDCTFNSSTETGIINKTVRLTDITDTLLAITTTNSKGEYDFNVSKGQAYKIVFKDTNKLTYGCSGNGILNVSNVSASKVNFGLNCTGTDFGVNDANVEAGAFRIGFSRNLNFSVNTVAACNSDTLRGIEVILDSALQAADSLYPSNPAYPKFTSISGDTVKYNLNQTKATDFSDVDLPLYTDTSASINDTLCATINLITNTDIDPSNDTKTVCQNAINAVDPNNKVVSPKGTDSVGFLQDSTTLTYTINFQNTGNATAVNATVIDTLDQGLDPNTVTVINSSDNPTLTIDQNRILKFDMPNINLPDSGSNLSGSQGFITFEVSPKAGVAADSQFTNYADIIFDQNKPIRTDTVINTICPKIGDTIQRVSCNQFTIPGDGRVVSSSGTYFDSFTAANGCDSIVRIDLKIINSGQGFIRDTGFCSVVLPSKSDTVYSDGLYIDTIKNGSANGCDSIINVSVFIEDTSRKTIQRTACSSYEVPSGDETYMSTGQYNDTVTNARGCVTIFTINLTIQPFATKVISATKCNQYEVPSGDETYQTSGQYMDTIQGTGGCDTVLTINLTIENFVRTNVTRSVCDSFTVPSGDETYKNSGTYLDTIVRPNTCDSILEIDLTILPDKQSALNVTTCGSYTVPSGDETYTTDGTYEDTIPSSDGCDSVIFISLSFKQAINNSISPVACNSYTVPSGDETYNVNGTYKDTLTTSDGCDSILTINLTVKEEVTSTISRTSCGSYTVPSGDETYTVSGTYLDTVPSSKGCDSVITINLTAGQDKQVTTSIKSCNTYTVPSGDETYSSDGTYQDTIPTAAGCDSILTINLTLGSLDTSLSRSGKKLIANAPNAQYQWLICDSNGYRPIDGSSDKSFRAFKSNSYAVAITQGNCQDTSACYSVQNVGIPGKLGGDNITIYPNPAQDKLNVVVNSNVNQLEMINMTGQRIIQKDVIGEGTKTLDLNNVAEGIYMLKLYSDKGIQSRKVIVR